MIVVGHRDCPRVAAVQRARVSLGLAEAEIVPWCDYLRSPIPLPPGEVRLESPGRDFAVERQLMHIGGDDNALSYPEDRGRLWNPSAWLCGWQRTLHQLADSPHIDWMSHPHDIADLFDKRRTYSRCFAAGVSLPKAFPGITTLDELQTQMIAQRRRRVFVKLAGGSSASGVAAYTIGPRGHRVLTTVEMVRVDGQWRYYNSRRLQLYESPEQIAQLLGYLLGQGAHIEDWVPKGSYNGATFDLRVVTIGGEPRHTIVRLSHGPMTNLHLLNRRCEVEGLRQLVPADSWERMLESVRRTAQAFPRCWMLGVDVAFTPTLRQHVVLEANAFGDQLPGLLDRGDDTYTAQFRAWQNRSDRLM